MKECKTTKSYTLILPIHSLHQAQIQNAFDALVMWNRAKTKPTVDRSFCGTVCIRLRQNKIRHNIQPRETRWKTGQCGNVSVAQNPTILKPCFIVFGDRFGRVWSVYRSLHRVRNPNIFDLLMMILVEHGVVDATFERQYFWAEIWLILPRFWTCATRIWDARLDVSQINVKIIFIKMRKIVQNRFREFLNKNGKILVDGNWRRAIIANGISLERQLVDFGVGITRCQVIRTILHGEAFAFDAVYLVSCDVVFLVACDVHPPTPKLLKPPQTPMKPLFCGWFGWKLVPPRNKFTPRRHLQTSNGYLQELRVPPSCAQNFPGTVGSCQRVSRMRFADEPHVCRHQKGHLHHWPYNNTKTSDMHSVSRFWPQICWEVTV